ncbi:MAG: FeoA family protein [Lachnospiraceae bacterium]|nr:FeoA family protein [Lachnospiraceae bacterium]
MTLNDVDTGKEVIIKEIHTDDEDMKSFLFSLGCYSGEPITVVARKRRNLVLAIKDGRYNVDSNLASVIEIAE